MTNLQKQFAIHLYVEVVNLLLPTRMKVQLLNKDREKELSKLKFKFYRKNADRLGKSSPFFSAKNIEIFFLEGKNLQVGFR